MNWRSLFGAWYVQDVVRVRSDLTLSLGLRDEFSTGWNEAHGRAANYTAGSSGLVCASQPAKNVCLPGVGDSLFTINRAKFLPQPRIGIAWRPFDQETVVHAGFGVYNDLQDALGYRADQNAPANPVYTIGATSLTNLFGAAGNPIQRSAPPPTTPSALLLPGGVQPDMYTPTLVSYSLRIERDIFPHTSLTVGYVGSPGYPQIIALAANPPAPVVCPA